jgi:hypothetical protein
MAPVRLPLRRDKLREGEGQGGEENELAKVDLLNHSCCCCSSPSSLPSCPSSSLSFPSRRPSPQLFPNRGSTIFQLRQASTSSREKKAPSPLRPRRPVFAATASSARLTSFFSCRQESARGGGRPRGTREFEETTKIASPALPLPPFLLPAPHPLRASIAQLPSPIPSPPRCLPAPPTRPRPAPTQANSI